MNVSRKDINRPALALVVISNATLYCTVLFGFDVGRFPKILQDFESYIPSVFLVIFVGILNSQLDHTAKARLVFWRWKNPLPGSRAFSEIMYSDSRVDPTALLAFKNPLPADPTEQNSLWYKWYRETQDESAVNQVHREYLFTRDWAGLAVLMSLALVPLGFWQMENNNAVLLMIAMTLQYLIVRRSARNHGERFVATVLALKSSSG